MSIPGWRPFGGSWTTHLPGWPQPVPPLDYEAINAARLRRAITVTLNGFTASNVDAVGTREQISLGALDGWWEPVGDATERAAHPTGDGDIGFRLRQEARTVTVAGSVKTDFRDSSGERLMTIMDEVNAQTRSGVLQVEEHMRGMHREVDVRRRSLQLTAVGHSHAVFTLVLVADDPLRYGSSEQALPRNTTVRVRNYGDAPRCYPILEWTGAATNPGIDFGSLSWRLGQNTVAGDRIVVNCAEGLVYRNGSRIFPAWTGNWPYTQGGAESPFTAIGTSMVMRRRSAWN